MEGVFDHHIRALMEQLDRASDAGTTLDLGQALSFLGYDLIGHLAFDRDFGTQVAQDATQLPPFHDSLSLGSLHACISPSSWLKKLTFQIPWVRKLMASRDAITKLAEGFVKEGMERYKDKRVDGTLLSSLIAARDPVTGQMLTPEEITSEAFIFLYTCPQSTCFRPRQC